MTDLVERLAREHLGVRADEWLALLRPAVRLVRAWGRYGDLPPVARIGGLPVLPPSMPWPLDEGGDPLPYVAELDCAALAAYELDVALAPDGRLLFFGDDLYDGGTGWHVEHVTGPAERRAAPAEHLTFGEGLYAAVPVRTFPTPPREHPALRAWRDDEAFGDALYDTYDDTPCHQVGGYPVAVQGPVEEEAPGDPAGWTCLLQVDTDDDLDLMWGDTGTAYWLVRRDTGALAYTVQAC